MAKEKKEEESAEDKAVRDNRANQKNPNNKEYKNPVLFLYKSKEGKHLFAFNMEIRDVEGRTDGGMVLGGDVRSLLVNVADIEKLLSGEYKSVKISVMPMEG